VPSVQYSVKRLVAESLTLPSAALGKVFFAECPIKGTRQRGRHSAKPRIPVVSDAECLMINLTKVSLYWLTLLSSTSMSRVQSTRKRILGYVMRALTPSGLL
jgi:hypothetical protein